MRMNVHSRRVWARCCQYGGTVRNVGMSADNFRTAAKTGGFAMLAFAHRRYQLTHLLARRRCPIGIVSAAMVLVMGSPTSAQTPPSLAGKTVRVVIGSPVAGTYDLLGRLVARHIGNHLPGNPTVVPQNM